MFSIETKKFYEFSKNFIKTNKRKLTKEEKRYIAAVILIGVGVIGVMLTSIICFWSKLLVLVGSFMFLWLYGKYIIKKSEGLNKNYNENLYRTFKMKLSEFDFSNERKVEKYITYTILDLESKIKSQNISGIWIFTVGIPFIIRIIGIEYVVLGILVCFAFYLIFKEIIRLIIFNKQLTVLFLKDYLLFDTSELVVNNTRRIRLNKLMNRKNQYLRRKI